MKRIHLTFAAALITTAFTVPALAADDSTTPAPAPSNTETTTPPPPPSETTAPAPSTTDTTTPPTDDKSGKDAKSGDDKPKPTNGGSY